LKSDIKACKGIEFYIFITAQKKGVMDHTRDRKFYVSSVGELFKKSLEMFAEKITKTNGNEILSKVL